MKMMWEMVAQMVARGFITSDLYIVVEPATVEAGEGSQHTILDGSTSTQYQKDLIKGVQRTQEMGMAVNCGRHFPM